LNITEKKLENSMIELTIEVPIDKVELEYKSVFNQLQSKVKIDGFRKGKAPLALVESQYIDYADKEVAQNLVKSLLYEAVNEKQLTPLVAPDYDFEKISRSEPFTFKATLEMPPKVDVAAYKDLSAEERVCSVSTDDIDDEISSLREQDAVFKTVEGASIKNGNKVKLKLKRVNAEPQDAEQQEYKEFSIIVGRSRDESALDKQIVGMKAGEDKEMTVKYPKDYYIKELAGQKAVYHVKVESVEEVELPALDDEFAVKKGFSSVSDMKVKIKERVTVIANDKTRGEVKGKLLKDIIEKGKYEIPPSMIRSEMEEIFRKYQQRTGYYADNIEKFAEGIGIEYENFLQRLAGEAFSSLQVTLTLLEIISKESLAVNEDKYRDAVQKLTERLNMNFDETEKFITDNKYKEKIENDILFDEALDFVYNNSKIKKLKPVSFYELIRSE
jgi:trigger factor